MRNAMTELTNASSGTTSPLPPWRPLLKVARAREGRQPAARWLQLATTGLDGTPRVRTLVFRGWHGDDRLELYTDTRSAKFAELMQQPKVELCWLLPKAKQQYRFRAKWLREEQNSNAERWQSLSPQGRALWGWPPPGLPLERDAEFPEQLDDSVALPENFLVVQLQIYRVERLHLTYHPHQRTLWCREDDWCEQKLNP